MKKKKTLGYKNPTKKIEKLIKKLERKSLIIYMKDLNQNQIFLERLQILTGFIKTEDPHCRE